MVASVVTPRLKLKRLVHGRHLSAGDAVEAFPPGQRLVGKCEAQARPIRQHHPTISDLEPLIEGWLQPFDVLHPCLVWVCTTQVDMDFHHEMRGELEPGQIGDGGDFQERSDTPNAGRVGLHEGHRAVTDQFRALGKTAEHLTARDGRVQPLREHGMAGVIVSTQGLFQPN